MSFKNFIIRMEMPVIAPIALDINLDGAEEPGFVSQNESLVLDE